MVDISRSETWGPETSVSVSACTHTAQVCRCPVQRRDMYYICYEYFCRNVNILMQFIIIYFSL
jgi:hypothetical protein